jgi:Zn-dependent protease
MLLRLFPEHVDVLIILLPTLVFSLCFHEFSHGYIAYKLGDQTAAKNGRLTLNPLAHLDPIGSLMILFVGFGWAKPVPVNPANFSNPRIDMIKVAFAGPASNLILAFIAGTILRLTILITLLSHNNILIIFLQYFMWVNIALAVFNMLPVAPLDGSQIFGNMIAKNNPELALKLQISGPKVLMILIIISFISPKFSIFSIIMNPFIKLFMYLFAGL